MDEGWLPKPEFVMPTLPPGLGIDPVVAALVHVAAFLELSQDEAVDLDAAVEAQESVHAYLRRLPPEGRIHFRAQLACIAEHAASQEGPEEFLEFLATWMDDLGDADDA